MWLILAGIETLLFLSCALGTPIAELNQEPKQILNVELAVTSSDIFELDPVILKVSVTNKSMRPFVLCNPLGAEFGTVSLRIRPKGRRNWSMAGPPIGETMLSLYGDSYTISPMAKRVCYDTAFRWRQSFLFEESNMYELHVVVGNKEQSFRSAPVCIEVKRRPARERIVIEKHIDLLTGAISAGSLYEAAQFRSALESRFGSAGPTASERIDVLHSIQERLSESRLKEVLQWQLALYSLRVATQPKPEELALRDINTVRNKVDPLATEFIDTLLASELLRKRRFKIARTVAERIEEPSDVADWIKEELMKQKE